MGINIPTYYEDSQSTIQLSLLFLNYKGLPQYQIVFWVSISSWLLTAHGIKWEAPLYLSILISHPSPHSSLVPTTLMEFQIFELARKPSFHTTLGSAHSQATQQLSFAHFVPSLPGIFFLPNLCQFNSYSFLKFQPTYRFYRKAFSKPSTEFKCPMSPSHQLNLCLCYFHSQNLQQCDPIIINVFTQSMFILSSKLHEGNDHEPLSILNILLCPACSRVKNIIDNQKLFVEEGREEGWNKLIICTIAKVYILVGL